MVNKKSDVKNEARYIQRLKKERIYLTSIILFLLPVRHNFYLGYLVIVVLIYISLSSFCDRLKEWSSPIPLAN